MSFWDYLKQTGGNLASIPGNVARSEWDALRSAPRRIADDIRGIPGQIRDLPNSLGGGATPGQIGSGRGAPMRPPMQPPQYMALPPMEAPQMQPPPMYAPQGQPGSFQPIPGLGLGPDTARNAPRFGQRPPPPGMTFHQALAHFGFD